MRDVEGTRDKDPNTYSVSPGLLPQASILSTSPLHLFGGGEIEGTMAEKPGTGSYGWSYGSRWVSLQMIQSTSPSSLSLYTYNRK